MIAPMNPRGFNKVGNSPSPNGKNSLRFSIGQAKNIVEQILGVARSIPKIAMKTDRSLLQELLQQSQLNREKINAILQKPSPQRDVLLDHSKIFANIDNFKKEGKTSLTLEEFLSCFPSVTEEKIVPQSEAVPQQAIAIFGAHKTAKDFEKVQEILEPFVARVKTAGKSMFLIHDAGYINLPYFVKHYREFRPGLTKKLFPRDFNKVKRESEKAFSQIQLGKVPYELKEDPFITSFLKFWAVQRFVAFPEDVSLESTKISLASEFLWHEAREEALKGNQESYLEKTLQSIILLNVSFTSRNLHVTEQFRSALDTTGIDGVLFMGSIHYLMESLLLQMIPGIQIFKTYEFSVHQFLPSDELLIKLQTIEPMPEPAEFLNDPYNKELLLKKLPSISLYYRLRPRIEDSVILMQVLRKVVDRISLSSFPSLFCFLGESPFKMPDFLDSRIISWLRQEHFLDEPVVVENETFSLAV